MKGGSSVRVYNMAQMHITLNEIIQHEFNMVVFVGEIEKCGQG
jgi:hypothetical protein